MQICTLHYPHKSHGIMSKATGELGSRRMKIVCCLGTSQFLGKITSSRWIMHGLHFCFRLEFTQEFFLQGDGCKKIQRVCIAPPRNCKVIPALLGESTTTALETLLLFLCVQVRNVNMIFLSFNFVNESAYGVS